MFFYKFIQIKSATSNEKLQLFPFVKINFYVLASVSQKTVFSHHFNTFDTLFYYLVLQMR